ncbi:MAG: DUF2079 domain-containing protein [Clostridiales bacterium]|nr:DUF2079 domain-containing protein [Clostridiales bacterium]
MKNEFKETVKAIFTRFENSMTVILSRFLLSFFAAWFGTGILSRSFMSAASMDFFRKNIFRGILIEFLIVFIVFYVLIPSHKNIMKIVFLFLVLAYSVLAAYNYSGGVSDTPAWLYGIALCVPPVLSLVYAHETVLATLSKLKIPDKSLLILYAMFGIMCAAFISAVTCMRYYTFSVSSFDFGIFAQMFDNMRKTGLPYTTLEQSGEILHFQVHVSPIYYLMLPFYLLFPFPNTIQIQQAIVIAAGIIPLGLLCKRKGLSNTTTFFIGLLYIFFPALSGGAMYDIHENCFLTVLILLVFYALETKNNLLLLVSALLVCAVKEDASFYIVIIGLYCILRSEQRRGICLAAFAVIYFLIAMKLLSTFGETRLEAVHLGNFLYDSSSEGVMGQVVKAIFMNPAYFFQECASGNLLQFLGYMILPLAGMILYQKNFTRYVLFIPFLIFTLTPGWPYHKDIGFQYNFANTGIFFYLAIDCLAELKPEKRDLRLCISVFVTVVLFSASMFPKLNIIPFYQKNRDNFQNMEHFLSAIDIPENASITVSHWFTTHLWQYRTMFDLSSNPQNTSNTEYIVIDARNSDLLEEGQKMLGYWGNYTLFDALPDKIEVYKRTTLNPKDLPTNELNGIIDFEKYLDALSKTPYTIFIVAQDEASSSIIPVTMAKLKSLGVQSNLAGKYRWSFIAICENDLSLYEKLSEESLTYVGFLENEVQYSLRSEGFSVGNNCSVVIDGKEYSVSERGLNFVVLNKETMRVVDSVCFDTFSSDFPATRTWGFAR